VNEIRVEYRDSRSWGAPVLWVAVFGLTWLLLRHNHTMSVALMVSLTGHALIVARMVETAIRARRGLTLCADGIVWHRHELFVPWSNVTEVSASFHDFLLVKAVDPEQPISDVTLTGKAQIRASLRRFDAIIALEGKRLGVPLAEVIAECARLREEYTARGGFSAFADGPAWPGRLRAARRLRIWAAAGSAGLPIIFLGAVMPTPSHVHVEHSGGLLFRFQRMNKAGFIDQVLLIKNPRSTAVAPTLTLVPLDGHGRPKPGVSVRTAFGSERGLVVVPPHQTVYDILAFGGPGFRDVIDVKAVVRAEVPLSSPTDQMLQPFTEPTDEFGNPTIPREPFAKVILRNISRFQASVRTVCIVWEPPLPGSPQQMIAALPIGGLTHIDPFGEASVALTGRTKDFSRECGDVKTYLAR
jgi:hypothetical protein